jgi:hypothetical protein
LCLWGRKNDLHDRVESGLRVHHWRRAAGRHRRRISITFDPAYGSCQAGVILGREGGTRTVWPVAHFLLAD